MLFVALIPCCCCFSLCFYFIGPVTLCFKEILFQGFVSRFRAPFSSSCSAGLVVVNSLCIYLSEKDCVFPLFIKLSFAGYEILG